MKTPLLCSLGLIFLTSVASTAFAAATDQAYVLGPDSAPQPGVPQGKVGDWEKLPSTVFPGTLHDFCVYVPVQYDGSKPVSLMIVQDGQAWVNPAGEYRTAYVLDNLIYRREIPVMIAVFINPGRTPEQPMATLSSWGDQGSNRPTEYNAIDDKYTKVITDELLPELNKRYKISTRPEDRALAGASSGAIAAFTVAWHRPDQFSKVISTIGSFVNLRGGHVYPDLIRSSDRKPIRIFLQDGLNDNRGVGGGRRGNPPAAAANTAPGTTPAPATPATPPPAPAPNYNADRDWHGQNIKMVAALSEKGYDVNYSWGVGTHNNRHGGAILPEMMRWLWRDYPRGVDDPRDASNRGFLLPAGWEPPAAAGPASPAPATTGSATPAPAR
jgi:predicted alpha/beta superfamily hydrolase